MVLVGISNRFGWIIWITISKDIFELPSRNLDSLFGPNKQINNRFRSFLCEMSCCSILSRITAWRPYNWKNKLASPVNRDSSRDGTIWPWCGTVRGFIPRNMRLFGHLKKIKIFMVFCIDQFAYVRMHFRTGWINLINFGDKKVLSVMFSGMCFWDF